MKGRGDPFQISGFSHLGVDPQAVRSLVSGLKQRAERIFELPSNVRLMVRHDDIATGRQELPSISSMLRAMGEPFAEPGWLDVAYSLLSRSPTARPVLLHQWPI